VTVQTAFFVVPILLGAHSSVATKDDPLYFSYRDDGRKETQELTVRILSKTKASFDLRWTTDTCSSHLTGVGKQEPGDAESDSEGDLAYFVDEFIWAPKGGCWVSVRVEEKTRQRATALVADCPQACPRTERPLMHRAQPVRRPTGR
jgi:hypothetical protein